MKIIKNILLGAAVGLAAVLGSVSTEAAQPIVWTGNLTNASLTSAAVATTGSNGLSSVTFSNGTASQLGYVDTLQAPSVAISSWFNFTPTGPMAAASGAIGPGNVTTYWVGSQDLNSWVPWTNLPAANVPGSSNVFAAYTKLDATPFRYIAPSALVYTVTNAFCTNVPSVLTNGIGVVLTNQPLQLKVFLK